MEDDLTKIWKRAGRAEKILFESMVIYSVGTVILLAGYVSEYQSGLLWVAQYLTIPILIFSLFVGWALNCAEKKKLFSWKASVFLAFYLMVTIEPYVLLVNAHVGEVKTVIIPVALIKKDRLPPFNGPIQTHLGTFVFQENQREYSIYISKKFFDEAPIGHDYKLEFKEGSLGILYHDDSLKADRGILER